MKNTSPAQALMQVRKLGINKGDLLFAQVSYPSQALIGALLESVGSAGTLLVPAFHSMQNFLDPRPIVIDERTKPSKSRFGGLLLEHPKVERSHHPSHSFAAIGPLAQTLLEGHGPDSPSFLPVKKLSQLDGKMIVIGDALGFPTVHVAQAELGLSRKHFLRFFLHSWIRRGASVERWRPRELPGCSASFNKFFGAYRQQANLVDSYMGKTPMRLVKSSRQALACDLEILKQDPNFVDCKRAVCLTCGLRLYQPWRIPATVYRRFFKPAFQLDR